MSSMALLQLPWEIRQMIWKHLLDRPGKIGTKAPQMHLRHTRFTWSYIQLVPVLTVCKAINLELAPLLHARTTILDLSKGSKDLSRAPTWVFDHTQTLTMDMSSNAPISGAAEVFKQLKLVVLETHLYFFSASDLKPDNIFNAIKSLPLRYRATELLTEEMVTLLRIDAHRTAVIGGLHTEVQDTVRSSSPLPCIRAADFLDRSHTLMLLTTPL